MTNAAKLIAPVILLAILLPCSGGKPNIDRVVVEKAKRTLKLMNGDEVVKSYRIALGGAPKGHKQCQGDSRTPEGKYVIDSRNKNSRYHWSLHVSYPNAADIRAARKRGCDPGEPS